MPRTIPLTRGHVAWVDDADHAWLAQFKWYVSSQGYAVRTVRNHGRRQTVAMHRLITGAQPGQIVDHRDGDKLNNRRANLRLVTAQQNQHNRKPNAQTASGYKGVTRFRDRWQARIRVNGNRLHLGYYDQPRLAAEVYDAAARRCFGRYARTNAPKHSVTTPTVEGLLDAALKGEYPQRPPKPRLPGVPKRASGYRGVYWERARWRACLGVGGTKRHLGYFRDERAAAHAYDTAARAQHGSDARLNFPDEA